MNLDPWVEGLNVLDRREQVCRRVIDFEADETIIDG